MRWVVLLMLVAACGRIGFDAVGDGGDGGNPDAADASIDAVDISDLVAWWPLDDELPASGGAADRSGNGHFAACTACPASATGRRSGGPTAARFDGVDDIITLSARPAIDFAAGFTVAAWVRLERRPSIVEIVVSRANGTAGENSFAVSHTFSGLPEYFSQGFDALQGPSVLPLDQWLHLAITYDGTTKRLYVDGTLANSSTPGMAVTYDTQPLSIGADIEDNMPGFFLQGTIADVMLFERALSTSEIQQLAAP